MNYYTSRSLIALFVPEAGRESIEEPDAWDSPIPLPISRHSVAHFNSHSPLRSPYPFELFGVLVKGIEVVKNCVFGVLNSSSCESVNPVVVGAQ